MVDCLIPTIRDISRKRSSKLPATRLFGLGSLDYVVVIMMGIRSLYFELIYLPLKQL